MPRITKRTVEALSGQESERVVWDDDLKGFGVRVHPTGRKVYIVKTRYRGKPVKVTIGPHGAVTPAGVAATVPEADAETETRQASLEEILTRREEELDARVLGLVEQGKVSEGQGEVLRFEVSGYSAGITIALREQETRLPERMALADRYVEWVEGRMADAVGRPDGEVPAVDDQSERMSGHARVADGSGWGFMFAAREASRMVDAMGLVSALERPGNGLTLGKSVDKPPSTELRGLRAVRR